MTKNLYNRYENTLLIRLYIKGVIMRDKNKTLLFEQIYLEYKDNILKISMMYLKDYHLAEDAAQETFCRVLDKLHTLKDVTNIKPWITKIAVNICKDKLKKKSHTEVVTDYDNFNSPVNIAEKLDSRITVFQALQTLPIELREVIILYYYQEITQNEIAKILKVPETTVAYRLRSAKSKLKDYLREGYDE